MKTRQAMKVSAAVAMEARVLMVEGSLQRTRRASCRIPKAANVIYAIEDVSYSTLSIFLKKKKQRKGAISRSFCASIERNSAVFF